jgi:hypothetical protein
MTHRLASGSTIFADTVNRMKDEINRGCERFPRRGCAHLVFTGNVARVVPYARLVRKIRPVVIMKVKDCALQKPG